MRNLQQYNHHPSFRQYQEETINKILDIIEEGKYHNIVLQSPVGSGKSNIAYTVAKYLSSTKSDWKNFLMSSQNMLLDQYANEFSNDMAIVKGSDNYPCAINGKTFPEGPCQNHPKKTSLPCYSVCEYIVARERAKKHPITLSNLHYMFLQFDFTQQFRKRNLAIFDEAHGIESVIMDYRAIQITPYLIKKLNDIIDEFKNGKNEFWKRCRQEQENDEPAISFNVEKFGRMLEDKTLQEESQTFKERILPVFVNLINNIGRTIDNVVSDKFKELQSEFSDINQIEYELGMAGYGKARKIVSDLQKVCCKFSNFKRDYDKTEWVIDVEKDKQSGKAIGIVAKPVKVGYLVQDTFSRMADFRLFMSATICGYERFCENLGLDPNDTIYIEVPSTFPVENRPFYYSPIGKMNYQNMEKALPRIVNFVDDVLSKNPGVKGLIHSVSYKNAEFIKKNSKFSPRILTHDAKTKKDILDQFYKSKDKFLVSPSVVEGLDLKEDLSRIQILIKTPFLNLGDKQIDRRREIDPKWYAYQTVLAIQQAVGRSCRSPTDWCKTYILDSNFEFLYDYNEELFTSDFKQSIVWS